MKLTEGSEYEFFVEKVMKSPDGSNHFVVMGPDQMKYLILEKYYSYYNIVTGRKIICRIDRINCKGRTFLEPRNPFYTEGEIYSFSVENEIIVTDRKGRKKRVLNVSDNLGHRIEVYPGTENLLAARGKEVYLRIKRISKGRFYLS